MPWKIEVSRVHDPRQPGETLGEFLLPELQFSYGRSDNYDFVYAALARCGSPHDPTLMACLFHAHEDDPTRWDLVTSYGPCLEYGALSAAQKREVDNHYAYPDQFLYEIGLRGQVRSKQVNPAEWAAEIDLVPLPPDEDDHGSGPRP